eukprot:Hpha_TRINITY_DN20265_c0_g1::TRINITY_DN20265_c0_g1_i1::g.168290::m.168290
MFGGQKGEDEEGLIDGLPSEITPDRWKKAQDDLFDKILVETYSENTFLNEISEERREEMRSEAKMASLALLLADCPKQKIMALEQELQELAEQGKDLKRRMERAKELSEGQHEDGEHTGAADGMAGVFGGVFSKGRLNKGKAEGTAEGGAKTG